MLGFMMPSVSAISPANSYPSNNTNSILLQQKGIKFSVQTDNNMLVSRRRIGRGPR